MNLMEKLKGLLNKDLTNLFSKAQTSVDLDVDSISEQSINQLPQKVMSDTTVSFDPTLAIGAIQGQLNSITTQRDEAQAAMQKNLDNLDSEIKNLNGAIQYLQAFANESAPAAQPDAAPTADATTEDNAAAKGLG